MSISSALSNALTGLGAASRRTEVISDNVANALTPGYARRSLSVAAAAVGGRGVGVSVIEVVRSSDPRTTAERRRVEADAGGAGTLAAAEMKLAAVFGGADADGSVPSAAIAFETSLVRLADTPESEALQAEAAGRARGLAGVLGEGSRDVQRVRMAADESIGRLVATANEALARVEDLNKAIRSATTGGRGVAALEEERQLEIDKLAEIVPVRLAQRDMGEVAIYTPGGAILLDGRAVTLGFSVRGQITPDMTLASGALSGLTIDGRAVAPGADGPLAGGALSAHFEVRDRIAPAASAQLDALAADLVRRFEDAGVDPTITSGAPGLFTDQGGVLDPAIIQGLAGRIAINSAVDPQAGGEPWRLRDGIYAVAPGPVGLDDLPRAMVGALSQRMPAPAGAGVTGLYGFPDMAEAISADRLQAEAESAAGSAFRSGKLSVLKETEAAATGVDTDQEMSDLLLAEQAYAANAKVLETVDRLLQRLLQM